MNVVISVRRSKGVDIGAACGQLYYQQKKLS
jgi:adenine C2-methylase RlmN of 23S rRNA A2503 and tRNA A37